jgi:pimeloyl-ACP methyl ester carboxylesterase
MSHTQKTYGILAADDCGVSDDRAPVIFLHGLSFDRRQWQPTMCELASISPGRRMVAFDLPGHGASPSLSSYDVRDLADIVHEAAAEAELEAPVVVGHSFGGVLATSYAARFPARGVINIDQPLRAEGFARMLRQAAPALRGPEYATIWNSLVVGMHAELLPEPARRMVLDSPIPSRELLLGYWRELLEAPPAELSARVERDLAALRSNSVPYRYVAGEDPNKEYTHWLRSMLPDVAITAFPGSGHFPHLARPRELAELLA